MTKVTPTYSYVIRILFRVNTVFISRTLSRLPPLSITNYHYVVQHVLIVYDRLMMFFNLTILYSSRENKSLNFYCCLFIIYLNYFS